MQNYEELSSYTTRCVNMSQIFDRGNQLYSIETQENKVLTLVVFFVYNHHQLENRPLTSKVVGFQMLIDFNSKIAFNLK